MKTNPKYFSSSLPFGLVLLERNYKTGGFSSYVSHPQLSGLCVEGKSSIKLIDDSFFIFAPQSLE